MYLVRYEKLLTFYSMEVDEGSLTSNKVKAAFELIGLELKESGEGKVCGAVDYKMKHIRLQNRHLKMTYKPNKNKHIRFDDDGNEQREEVEVYSLFDITISSVYY